jgi:hypothetical protein
MALLCATLAGCQASKPVLPVEPALQPKSVPVTPSKPSPEMATLSTDKGETQVDLATFNYSGQGTLLYANGTKARGEWFEGKLHGFGELQTKLQTFQGNWQAGRRHGHGTALYRDGSRYEGDWAQDQHHGYGTITYPNRVTYEGMWQAGKRQGFGLEQRPDHSSVKGQWQKDQRDGHAVARFADGSSFEGEWENGYAIGSGTLNWPTGITIIGAWIDEVVRHGLIEFPEGPSYAGKIFTGRNRAYESAFANWLELTARAGSPSVQYLLAKAHLESKLENANLQTGLSWLERSAEQGFATAQYELADLLVNQDWSKAEDYLLLAAAQKHPDAHARLAEFYHRGHHYAQNLTLAVSHYQVAVALNNLSAINNYAWLLATTDTSIADPEQALQLIGDLVLYLDSWQLLDTYAAAHARLGRFSLATNLQKRVISGARETTIDNLQIADLQERLRLYKSELPFLE